MKPKIGDKRIRKGFAITPTKLNNGDIVLFKRYKVEEEYGVVFNDNGLLTYGWKLTSRRPAPPSGFDRAYGRS